jgi:hypothetical protein
MLLRKTVCPIRTNLDLNDGTPFHTLSELFAQLGLANSPDEVEAFLQKRSLTPAAKQMKQLLYFRPQASK